MALIEDYQLLAGEGVHNFLAHVVRPILAKSQCGSPLPWLCPCVYYLETQDLETAVDGLIDLLHHEFRSVPEGVQGYVLRFGLCDLWDLAWGSAYLDAPEMKEAGYYHDEIRPALDRIVAMKSWTMALGRIRQMMDGVFENGPSASVFLRHVESHARAWQWTPPQQGCYTDGAVVWCKEDGEMAVDRAANDPDASGPITWTREIEGPHPYFCVRGTFCAHVLPTDGPDLGAPIDTLVDGEELFDALCSGPSDERVLVALRYACYQYRLTLMQVFEERLARGFGETCPLWMYVSGEVPFTRGARAAAPAVEPAPAEIAMAPGPYVSPIARRYQQLKARGFKTFESAEEERAFHRRLMPNVDCRAYHAAISAIADQVITDPAYRQGLDVADLYRLARAELLRIGVGYDYEHELVDEAVACGFTVRPEHTLPHAEGDERSAAGMVLCFDVVAEILWKTIGYDRVRFASELRQRLLFPPDQILQNPAADEDDIVQARNAIWHNRGDTQMAYYELLGYDMEPDRAAFAIRAAEVLMSGQPQIDYDVITEEYDVNGVGF